MTIHQQPGLRSSSADPFVLSTYVTNATAMTTTLSQNVLALTDAAEALSAAGEAIPGLADFVASVTDLTGDWYHLDEFTGDVANGFLATLEPGYRPDGSPMVLTVDDRTLDGLGGIGFADRDQAVAAAEELAADYQLVLDAVADGDPLVWDPPGSDGAELSLEQMERMAGLLEGYGDDPAFAVTFTEALGVSGIIGMRDMYLTYAREARDVDRPRDHPWTEDGIATWVDEQMAGTAVVLHTAMDTRRDTASRTEPDNADLAGTDRLADDWVDSFETYGGDAQLDYSLLVVEADLPADVLVAVGDNHLGDHFGHADRGPDDDYSGLDSARPPTTEADLNIAAAIAANPDASLGWLTGDGIAAGTDTVDLVLTTPDIAPDMYTAFADIVDTGLTHPTDDTGRGELMEQTIRIVGDPTSGGIHAPAGASPDEVEDAADAMRQAFGHGAAANMDVLHTMITDDWGHAVSGEVPSEDALATHDFLRESMADEAVADRVAAGYVTYAVEQLGPDNLPEPGVDSSPGDLLDDRRELLQQIGTLEGTIVRAENNALVGSVEERIAEQQARGRSVNAGIDIAAFFAGTAPGYGGLVVGGVDTATDVAGVSVGELFFPVDESALDAAEEEATASEGRANVNFATLNALAKGAEAAPIDPTDGVSDDERLAYEAWLIENHYDGPAHDAMIAGASHAEIFENRR